MRDPFPIRTPPLLFDLTYRYIAVPLNLTTLPLHIHEVIGFFLLYHSICAQVSPYISSRLFPSTYPKLPWRTKLNWDVHVVSLVQSTLICALAFWTMSADTVRKGMSGSAATPGPDVAGTASAAVLGTGDFRERVWGYTGATGLVQAAATGYFLWDLWVSVVHVDVFGVGLLAHAVAACYVYGFGFRPFVNYYAPSFVLYEISSPFLNVHWFLDKLNRTGSPLQFANGILLISSFFGCRLVWGVWQSVLVFFDIYKAVQYQSTTAGKTWLATVGIGAVGDTVTPKWALRSEMENMSNTLRFARAKPVPLWLAVTYLSANLTLTGLNVVWFGKMIATIRKRFDPPLGTKGLDSGKVKTEGDPQVVMGRGVYEDGTKTVEVASKEVRKRSRKA